MSKIDEFKSRYQAKVEQMAGSHATRLADEIKTLRQEVMNQPVFAGPPPQRGWEAGFDRSLLTEAAPLARPLIDMTGGDALQEIDGKFADLFSLGRYYPTNDLNYPTRYCETAAEFYTPLLESLNLSAEMKKRILDYQISEAEDRAAEGGGIFGVDLPGQGCYLNGWLFGRLAKLSPREAFNAKKTRDEIFGTAVHEKLGHGFLCVYGALGTVSKKMGSVQVEYASQFGQHLADDPLMKLRQEQAQLLLRFSFVLEEGWATWIQSYFSKRVFHNGEHPRYRLQTIVSAIDQWDPGDIEGGQDVKKTLQTALYVLFVKPDPTRKELHEAMVAVDLLGFAIDPLLQLRQPMRYIVGELLFSQAAAHLGESLMPYVGLIAANVSLDPAQISLADLRELMRNEPGLNPDSRLAAISRLQLSQPGSMEELVHLVETDLSLAVPRQLKKE